MSSGARPALDVLVFYAPVDSTDRVLEALFDAGAGAVGEYDRCAFRQTGTGQFRPSEAADPAIGERGIVTRVAEERCELVFPCSMRAVVVAALRAAHPYEEPAFHVIETAAVD